MPLLAWPLFHTSPPNWPEQSKIEWLSQPRSQRPTLLIVDPHIQGLRPDEVGRDIKLFVSLSYFLKYNVCLARRVVQATANRLATRCA